MAEDLGDARVRRLKLTLFCAFGAMLLLMIGSGWEVMRLLGELNAAHQRVQSDYMQRMRMAEQISSAYRNYAVKARQELAASAAEQEQQQQKQELPEVTQVVEVVEHYPHPLTPDEEIVLRRIYVTLARHRAAMQSALGDDPRKRTAAVQQLLAADGDTVLASAQGLQALNAGALHQNDSALEEHFGTLRARSLLLLAVALASGLMIALGSLAYILKLQREAQFRYLEISENRSELKKLSARLVETQESERKALSRELHDEIGQSLGSLLVDVGRLSALVPGENQASTLVGKIKGEAEHVIQSVRSMALLLRPSMLDDLGLIPALEWQAREVSRQGAAEVEVYAEDIPDNVLPDSYRTCVYRVVQEALHNVSRHSGATHARIDVQLASDKLTVSVQDDGRGFDPHTRGLGLVGMGERVKDLGGTLTIDSQEGAGTIVRAVLPLPAASCQS
jgi:signal transduction histidine kinase